MSITSWNRLEPRTRGARLTSLQARCLDPLWLLARQWQLGEFTGEDAGSPVSVHLTGEVTRPTRYLSGAAGAGLSGTAYPAGVPLAALAEAVPSGSAAIGPNLPTGPDLRARAEAGAEFLRRLGADLASRYAAGFVAAFPLPSPVEPLDGAGRRALSVLIGRLPDGAALRAEVGGWLPREPEVHPDDADEVRKVIAGWLAWYDARYPAPATVPAWRREQLGYEFAVAAPSASASTGEVVLRARAHRGGPLDWYAFDLDPTATLGAAKDGGREALDIHARPTPVVFPGMPAARWWQFENARVDLGSLDVAPDDLARLLLLEFALAYGNDYFQVPLDLPTGSLCRITSMTVTNTFGQTVTVTPARDADGASPTGTWRMFSLAPADPAGDWLFVPALASVMDGPAMEEVALMRDEMANVVWAVERRVRSAAGLPMDRHEVEATGAPEPPPEGEALRYELASPVPAHWLPLLPTQLVNGAGGRSTRLRLGGLHPPRSMLLSGGPAAINDEEAPREGLVVSRRRRRTRGVDGAVHVWTAYHWRVGAGGASSDLTYDRLVREPGDA